MIISNDSTPVYLIRTEKDFLITEQMNILLKEQKEKKEQDEKALLEKASLSNINPDLFKKLKIQDSVLKIEETNNQVIDIKNKILINFISETVLRSLPGDFEYNKQFGSNIINSINESIFKIDNFQLTSIGQLCLDQIDSIHFDIKESVEKDEVVNANKLNGTLLEETMLSISNEVKNRILNAVLIVKNENQKFESFLKSLNEMCSEEMESTEGKSHEAKESKKHEIDEKKKEKLMRFNSKRKKPVLEMLSKGIKLGDSNKTEEEILSEAITAYSIIETFNILGLSNIKVSDIEKLYK